MWLTSNLRTCEGGASGRQVLPLTACVRREELTEVITSAEFHPNQCSMMMYSSSKGTIKLCDLRDSALCDKQAKKFEEEVHQQHLLSAAPLTSIVQEDPATKSFFSEIISSISDIKFSADGRFIISRDYMTIKLWDMVSGHEIHVFFFFVFLTSWAQHKEDKPVKSIPVHDYLKTKLCDLYENDCIFDKFELACSSNANFLLTGSYGQYFFVYDVLTDKKERIEIRKKGAKSTFRAKFSAKKKERINPDTILFDKKSLQGSRSAERGGGHRFCSRHGSCLSPEREHVRCGRRHQRCHLQVRGQVI